MHLEVEWQAGPAVRRLARIGDRLDDPRGLLQHLVPELHDYEREVFATGGHGEWAPNAPGTVEDKGSSRILVNSGLLLDELTGNSDVMGETLSVGSTRPYAGYLRSGARGMPKRDPAPAPDGATVRSWGSELLTYVVDGGPG